MCLVPSFSAQTSNICSVDVFPWHHKKFNFSFTFAFAFALAKEHARPIINLISELCQTAIIIDHLKSHFSIWELMIGVRAQITCAIWHLFIEAMHLIWYKQAEACGMKIKCSPISIQLITPSVWRIGIYFSSAAVLHYIRYSLVFFFIFV